MRPDRIDSRVSLQRLAPVSRPAHRIESESSMNHHHFPPASLLALMLSAAIAQADVVDTPTERQLSLPSAKVRLALPRGDWVITDEERRSGDTAVFYALASEQRKTLFTVYIDKSTECLTAFTCRA